MKQRIEFGIGLSFRADGTKLSGVDTKLQYALEYAGELFGGANLSRGDGVWRDPRGKIVVEESATITTFTDSSDFDARMYATYLASLFEQEAILVSISPVESFLVSRLESAA